MPIIVKCSCGQEVNAPDQYAGKRVRCPACKDVLTVPDPGAAAEVVVEDEAATYQINPEDAALPGHGIGLNEGVKRGRLANVVGFGMDGFPVNAVALSPEGGYALAGIGRMVFKLDLQTAEYCPLEAHEDTVTAVAASPDGRHAASANRVGNIMVWDVAARRGLRWLAGHSERVNGLAFAPSAAFLASVGEDATARLWEVNNGAELVRWRDDQALSSIAYSADGGYLLTGNRVGTVSLWDVQRAKMCQELESPLRGRVFAVAFSRQADWVMAAARSALGATGGAPGVALCRWKRADRPDKVRFRRPTLQDGYRHINAVAFYPNGTHCLVVGQPHEEYDIHERANHWTVPAFEIELSRGDVGLGASFFSQFARRNAPPPVPAAECLAVSADGDHYMIGFSDGSVGVR
jgi:hypothetical protein